MQKFRIFNNSQTFGTVAIILHWGMAALIIFLLGLGIYMVGLPVSLDKLIYYGWHKEWGILALFIGFLRWYWRFINTIPQPPSHLAMWQQIAGRMVHVIFYLAFIFIPLTGWFISSAAGLPVSFFGVFTLPDLVPVNKTLMQTMIILHKWFSYGLILLILIHSTAALYHHFKIKDNILRRMLP